MLFQWPRDCLPQHHGSDLTHGVDLAKQSSTWLLCFDASRRLLVRGVCVRDSKSTNKNAVVNTD